MALRFPSFAGREFALWVAGPVAYPAAPAAFRLSLQGFHPLGGHLELDHVSTLGLLGIKLLEAIEGCGLVFVELEIFVARVPRPPPRRGRSEHRGGFVPKAGYEVSS